MTYEEPRKLQGKPHGLRLEDRKSLAVSGVEDVESFDDTEVVMRTVAGGLLVRGQGLQIDKLSLDTGEVNVQGLVTELAYDDSAPAQSLWKRLFR